ncbi:hypothetical protein MKD33_14805, partial [Chromobacterium piscinae]
MPMKAIVSGLR